MPSDGLTSTRRARVRQQTMAEIRSTARQLLVKDGPSALSLRAIAREMGMTAPALYRYFDQHRDLVQAVVADIYDELASELAGARDPRQSPPEQLITVSRTLRRWTLAHPQEFRLLFAKPITDANCAPDDPCHDASWRFGGIFLDLMVECWTAGGRPQPSLGVPKPEWTGQLEELRARRGQQVPLEALYAFVVAWSRLYGMVSMEAFGHLTFAVVDPEPLFEDGLRQIIAELTPVCAAGFSSS